MKSNTPKSSALRDRLLHLLRVPKPVAADWHIKTSGRFPLDTASPNPQWLKAGHLLPDDFKASGHISDVLPFTTSDIRKMWPALVRRFQFNFERPLIKADVSLFLENLMATPFAGASFFECAFEAKVERPIIVLFRTSTGVVIPARFATRFKGEELEIPVVLALFANAWVFGDVPDELERSAIYERIFDQPYEGARAAPGHQDSPLGNLFRYFDLVYAWACHGAPSQQSEVVAATWGDRPFRAE